MSTIYYKFLLACLRGDGRTTRAIAETPGWDWERVFDEANREAILPVISVDLQERGKGALPPDVADFLSAVPTLNRERNALLLNEVEVIATLLNQVGIEPVLLKGAAYLAAGIYLDPAERYLGDIDILVSKESMETAIATLSKNGFIPDDSDRFGRFRHHHPPLRRTAQKAATIWIEIHHSVGPGVCASLLPGDEIVSKSLAYNVKGARVRIPCPSHLVTHLILHSQLLHPYNERIWPPLRNFLDLRQLQNHYGAAIIWPDVFKRFHKVRRFGIVTLHLKDAQDTLGVNIPVRSRMSGLTRLRWHRRRLLRRWPQLRYVDPIYMFSIGCTRRLRIVAAALKKPYEWKYFASQLFNTDVYLRFLTDVVEGRGR